MAQRSTHMVHTVALENVAMGRLADPPLMKYIGCAWNRDNHHIRSIWYPLLDQYSYRLVVSMVTFPGSSLCCVLVTPRDESH